MEVGICGAENENFYNIKMSYFIYLQPSNPSFNYGQEDLYSLIPFQTEPSSQSLYLQKEFYISPTFSTPPNFGEFPHQIESNAPISSSSHHNQEKEQETKEAKKKEKNFQKEI